MEQTMESYIQKKNELPMLPPTYYNGYVYFPKISGTVINPKLSINFENYIKSEIDSGNLKTGDILEIPTKSGVWTYMIYDKIQQTSGQNYGIIANPMFTIDRIFLKNLNEQNADMVAPIKHLKRCVYNEKLTKCEETQIVL